MQDPLAPPAILVRLMKPAADFLSLSTLPLHFHEVLMAWAVYTLIHTHGAPILSRYLFPRWYQSLAPRARFNCDVRIVSSVQAVFISTATLYVVFNDDERAGMDWRGRIWGYSGAGGLVQACAAGYFVWDVAVSAAYLKILGPGSLAHAVSALLITMLGFRPFANYYGLNFVLYALSTPFLNMHWFFDKLGMTGSRVQLYNGITLLTTFFCARVIWGNYQSIRIYSDVWKALQTSAVELPFTSSATVFDYRRNPDLVITDAVDSKTVTLPMWLVILYLGSNSVLNVLNVYWFGKMIQNVRSRFKSTGDVPGNMTTKLPNGVKPKLDRWTAETEAETSKVRQRIKESQS